MHRFTSMGVHSRCQLLLHAHWLLASRVHCLAQDVARLLCAAVRMVLYKDAHQMYTAVDSGCNENAE